MVAEASRTTAELGPDAIGSLDVPAAQSPWRSALGQLGRNKTAVLSFVVLVLIVALSVAAPLFASHVAHTNPFRSYISGTTVVNGKVAPILQPNHEGLGLGVTPIGPTWDLHHYFLGADDQGRDVMARLLYGGRNTLLIGASSAAICCLIAAVLGLVAGYFGGVVDWVLSRLFDLVWAFPVYLLAITVSVVLLTSGLDLGPVHIGPGNLLMPILIIAAVYVPYVARPLRGQVISLREREFVQAAVGTGASDPRLLWTEILPNMVPSVIVFFPLMMAFNMLTESALSFLSVGVQPPQASWGTIISDGLGLLYTRPMVAIAPGVMLVISAVVLNLLGDAVREAIDPQAKLRGTA